MTRAAEMGKLAAFLRRHRRLGLDTNVFVYQMEGHERFARAAGAVLAWVEREGHSAVASTITMAELLVAPYRVGDEDKVNEFYATLTTFPHLQWVAPELMIADGAARLRARYKLTMPDALIAATAVVAGATGLVTNDAGLLRVRELEVFVLDEAE